jgi:hypothetical protein
MVSFVSIVLSLLAVKLSSCYLVKETNTLFHKWHSRSILWNQESQREEQWRIQQDILARRKNKTKMKEYFEEVEKKRISVSKEAKTTKWANTKDDVDPLANWQKAKNEGSVGLRVY